MSKSYGIREFAALAGVTVKALHHYDRVGLLRPWRTVNGYRRYTVRDLERLEQIVALKVMGLSLQQIRGVLDGARLELRGVLCSQLRVLEEKRRRLGRAIDVVNKMIGAMAMDENIDGMQRYYRDPAAWSRHKHYFEEWPSEAWATLYRDIEAELCGAVSDERSLVLAIRWMNLLDSDAGGDAEIRWGMLAAWSDRQYWPAVLQIRAARFDLDRIGDFIRETIVRLKERYLTDEAWMALLGLRRSDAFLAVAASIGEDPASPRVQALVAGLWDLDPSREQFNELVRCWRVLAAKPSGFERQLALMHLRYVWRFIAIATYWKLSKSAA